MLGAILLGLGAVLGFLIRWYTSSADGREDRLERTIERAIALLTDQSDDSPRSRALRELAVADLEGAGREFTDTQRSALIENKAEENLKKLTATTILKDQEKEFRRRGKDRFEIYQDKNGEWRWRRKAVSGRIVAASAISYEAKQQAVENAGRGYLASDVFEFYEDKRGEYRWRRRAQNGDVVGASIQGFPTLADAKVDAKRQGYREDE